MKPQCVLSDSRYENKASLAVAAPANPRSETLNPPDKELRDRKHLIYSTVVVVTGATSVIAHAGDKGNGENILDNVYPMVAISGAETRYFKVKLTKTNKPQHKAWTSAFMCFAMH